MTAATKPRMNVNEYMAWARAHPGRYELSDGEVIAMSPEGAGHAAVKYAVQTALLAGIRARRLPCHMLPDGMTVRIDASAKLAGYFRLPSVMHYLIVDPDKPLVLHHARGSGETILTRVVAQGTIELDPPGLSVALADFYAG